VTTFESLKQIKIFKVFK